MSEAASRPTTADGGRVLLLVPARGGSKGIPRKNLQPVDGVSLVGRAVLVARRFLRERPLANARILLDTDDPAIAEEGRRWGAEVPFLRPPELARDDTTTLASTLHLVERLTSDGWTPDTIVLLQPTSPLRRWEDVAACWDRHVATGAPVISVVAASKPPQLAMRLDGDAVLHWLGAPPPPNARRQDLAAAVAPSGAVYVTPVETLRREGAFVVAGLTRAVECSTEASVDVDVPTDLALARRAALLAAPGGDVRVVEAAVGQPRDGDVVELPDAEGTARRYVAVDAARLAERSSSGDLPCDLLLLPAPDAPGVSSWRLACPGRLALWYATGEQLLQMPFAAGAADLVVVPRGAHALLAQVRTVVQASAALRA